ncbi:MAG: hypothetical protein NXY57DRAFT_1044971, partial [Lentinula lateritia]
GVNGIGHQTARGLAQSGFGDDLLSAYQLFSEDLQQLSQAFQKLNEDMVYEIEHNKQGITKFCTTYFAWSEKLTLEHLHTYLWSGVVMRMLCSKYIAYNSEKSEFMVPRLQTQIETDSKGKLYMPTLSTSIRKNALNFQCAAGDTISMTFSTTFFLQLTNLDSASAQTNRRLNVPVEMLAVAANRWDKVANLSQLIGPRPFPMLSAPMQRQTGGPIVNAGPSSLEPSVRPVMSAKRKQNGTHSRGNSTKRIHLGVIELTDSEDDA